MKKTAAAIPKLIQQGLSHHQAGRFAEAEAIYRQVLDISPNNFDAWHYLGLIAFQTGMPDVAADLVAHAVKLNPHQPFARNNLGAIYLELNRPAEAEASFRKAIELKSGYTEAHYNLGNALKQQDRLEESIASYQKALKIKPDHADALNNLGTVYKDLSRLDEARSCFEKVIALNPNHVEALTNIGNILEVYEELDEAENYYRRAISLNPNYAEVYSNLGTIYDKRAKYQEALAFFHKAISLNPNIGGMHHNLAYTLQNIHDMKGAIESYRNALKIDPGLAGAHLGLIFALDLVPELDTAELQKERKKWAERHAAPLLGHLHHPNVPDPDRVLRIGYVSGDFNNHSAANGFVSLLSKFDRSQFEVYAYSNSPKVDEITRLFQSSVNGWRNITGLSDQAVADLIKSDRIDILVDLSGFTRGNRLLAFARKPAPVQVTAMGYPTGTGMKAMDALFADRVVIPPEERQYYAEDVRYLPCVIEYSAQREFPEVNELPALSTGIITFGSFNRLAKITDESLALWARLLSQMPKSRMLIKTIGLDDEGLKRKFMQPFVQAGISKERIILLGKTSWIEHVAANNLVDIALDPFPHGGGVTTLESIMMGVPVVTMSWPTFAGRASASILTALGLTDWIADSPEKYIEIAMEKASDLDALAKLRKDMRNIYASSIFGDPLYYLKAAEKEYRLLWREWCARQH